MQLCCPHTSQPHFESASCELILPMVRRWGRMGGYASPPGYRMHPHHLHMPPPFAFRPGMPPGLRPPPGFPRPGAPGAAPPLPHGGGSHQAHPPASAGADAGFSAISKQCDAPWTTVHSCLTTVLPTCNRSGRLRAVSPRSAPKSGATAFSSQEGSGARLRSDLGLPPLPTIF